MGGRVKFLVDTPETLWGHLDAAALLPAARRFLRCADMALYPINTFTPLRYVAAFACVNAAPLASRNCPPTTGLHVYGV